jgi:tripeptidyl-peptidase I
MHLLQSATLLFSAAGIYASAVSSRSAYAVKERHVVPRAWSEQGRAPAAQRVNLQIGLKQSNEGSIEQHILEVSDPSHARYGQHLTAEEVADIVTPSDDTIDLVYEWLSEHNITDYVLNPSKDWISVQLPLEKVEKLLQTEYFTFKHEDGTTVSRAPEWSLPLYLHDHIDVVQPTNSFFRPTPRAQETKPLLDSPGHGSSWWHSHGKSVYGHGVSLLHAEAK